MSLQSLQLKTITTFLLLISSNPVQAEIQIISNNNGIISPDPIGRILAGDRNKKEGSLIFPGDIINPISENAKVRIICYLNQKILKLPKGKVDDNPEKCTHISKLQSNGAIICNPKKSCTKTRTINTNRSTPTINNIYNNIIQNNKPTISWNEIPNATSYTVSFKGSNFEWTKDTNKAKLTYPTQELPLQYGNIYKVNIIAKKGNLSIASSSRVLIMLGQEQIEDIQDTIQKIKDLNLSLDQEIQDIQTIYTANHLLTDSIKILKARIRSGTSNPTIYRLLGDRYFQVGLFQKAKQIYLQSIKLAKKENKPYEVELAKNALRFISGQQE